MESHGREKLARGDFNYMTQAWQPDGSVVILLSKRGEGKTYKFKVQNLYSKDPDKKEEVSEEEEISSD